MTLPEECRTFRAVQDAALRPQRGLLCSNDPQDRALLSTSINPFIHFTFTALAVSFQYRQVEQKHLVCIQDIK